MRGMYSGSYMRAYKILPKSEYVHAVSLSKEAKKRLEWIDWYHSHGKKVRPTLRHFSLSPDVFYRWLKKFNPYRLETLEDNKRTRTPKRLREMTTNPKVLERIYEIRFNDLEKSKYEIHEELKREGIVVAHNVIQKVINRHPELRNTEHHKRLSLHRKQKIARIKAASELREKELGSLVQIDTKHLSVLGTKYYLFSAVDCKSRFGFTYAYTTISSRSGKDFLRKVREYFPFPIQAINTDNGSEYLLNFHQEIESWGIPHYFTNPNCPKQNGRVERFHQTVEYEYLHYQDLYPDIELLRGYCMAFNQKYNYRRFHQSLGYQTPAEYVKSNVVTKEQVLRHV